MKHEVNLDLLADAACLLAGPNGAMALAAIYATLEKVEKRGYERGLEDGQQVGYDTGYIRGMMDEADDGTIDERAVGRAALALDDDLHTAYDADPACHFHPVQQTSPTDETYYDIWNKRMVKGGEAR